MSSELYPLRQSGIYRNVPTYDPSITGLKAMVCGATGISGFATVRALLDTPDRWSKIYTLSRSPLLESMLSLLAPEQRSRIQHVPNIDFTASGEVIANSLIAAGVKADYVFFYSYMQPKTGISGMSTDMADALVEANVPLFDNFLQSLPKAGIKPKRILLQTGGKSYGMHIGRVQTPLVESDPQPRHLQPNFYYPQEDLLFDFCQKHPETGWNVVRPFAVIGSSPNTPINMFLSFAAYAAVQAHKKEPLVFGSDFQTWQFSAIHSTARLNGYLSEWAVLEEKCRNQAFNAHDGSPLSWERFFHELARWYGVEKGVTGPETDESKFCVVKLAGGKESPLGYGPAPELKSTFTLAEWAKRAENMSAWEDIMQSSAGRIKHNPFGDDSDSFFIGDFAYLDFGWVSQNKVRRYRFSGFVDTLESVFEMYQEMAEMGMLPPLKVDAARPLV